MTIFVTSYQTSAGMLINNTRALENSLKEYLIKVDYKANQLNLDSEDNFVPSFITGLDDNEKDIPLFTHPITVSNVKGKNYVFTDLRMFVDKTGKVKNLTEYNFAKSRAILDFIWQTGVTKPLKVNLPFATVVFSNWIAEAVSNVYSLDFNDKLTLTIMASYYYQSLFEKDSIFTDETKQAMAVHTIKATKAQTKRVYEIFDLMRPVTNIKDFCLQVPDVLQNVRITNFNFEALLNCIRNSWYGNNSKEIISVALENPPTWLAIVYTAIVDNTYKQSSISKLVARLNRGDAAGAFKSAYIKFISEYINSDNTNDNKFSDYQ